MVLPVSLYNFYLFYIYFPGYAKCFSWTNSSNFDNTVSEMRKLILKEGKFLVRYFIASKGQKQISAQYFMTPKPMFKNHAVSLFKI